MLLTVSCFAGNNCKRSACDYSYSKVNFCKDWAFTPTQISSKQNTQTSRDFLLKLLIKNAEVIGEAAYYFGIQIKAEKFCSKNYPKQSKNIAIYCNQFLLFGAD